MAAELKPLGIEARIIEGARGVFDVVVEKKTVYSKDKTGKFPDAGEIAGLINEFLR